MTRSSIERAIDDVLEDSFPASDPPSWNLGIARPGPRAVSATSIVADDPDNSEAIARNADVIDTSRRPAN